MFCATCCVISLPVLYLLYAICCVVPTVHNLLCATCCVPPTVFCLLPTGCVLSTAMLRATYCMFLLRATPSSLFVGNSLLPAVYYTSYVPSAECYLVPYLLCAVALCYLLSVCYLPNAAVC